MLNNQFLDIVADKVLNKILNADAEPVAMYAGSGNTGNIYNADAEPVAMYAGSGNTGNIYNADAEPVAMYAGSGNTGNIYSDLYEKTVIVRTYFAGVFYGKLKKVESDSLILNDCRRIWKWYGANNLSNMALVGVTDKSQTRISPKTQNHLAKGFIEIIPMSTDAVKNLDSVSDWK